MVRNRERGVEQEREGRRRQREATVDLVPRLGQRGKADGSGHCVVSERCTEVQAEPRNPGVFCD